MDHKEWSFVSYYFDILKISFQLKNLLKRFEFVRSTNYPNVHIHTFRKRWGFI